MDDDNQGFYFIGGIAISLILGLFSYQYLWLIFDPNNFTDFTIFFTALLIIIAVILFYKGEYELSLKKRTSLNPVTSFDQIIMLISAIFCVWFFIIIGTFAGGMVAGMQSEDAIDTSAASFKPLEKLPQTQVIENTNVGFLKIDTNPEGAEIYLDESYIGTSPLSIELIPGIYLLTLHKEGIQDKSIDIDIKAEQMVQISPAGSPFNCPVGKPCSPNWRFMVFSGGHYSQ